MTAPNGHRIVLLIADLHSSTTNYPSCNFLLIVLGSFSVDSFPLEKNLCRCFKKFDPSLFKTAQPFNDRVGESCLIAHRRLSTPLDLRSPKR